MRMLFQLDHRYRPRAQDHQRIALEGHQGRGETPQTPASAHYELSALEWGPRAKNLPRGGRGGLSGQVRTGRGGGKSADLSHRTRRTGAREPNTDGATDGQAGIHLAARWQYNGQ